MTAIVPPPPATVRDARWGVLVRVEQSLRDAGWHPMSDAWLDIASSVYGYGARRVVVSGGRRGGKSSSICRFLVADCVAATMGLCHPVSPGDWGTFVVLSARREQADDRLRTIEEALKVLRLRFNSRYQKIELIDYPYRFAVLTASKDAVVSQTTCGAFLDELARWRESKTGDNPAKEVIASLAPSMQTMPEAIMWMASSPWIEGDLHQRELGPLGKGAPIEAQKPLARRVYARAPTWTLNPTITEEETRRDETDPLVWAREYAATPMSTGHVRWFSIDDLRACSV